MLEYLQKYNKNKPKNGLSQQEKLEFEHLKQQLERYKEIEKQENQEIVASEGSDSESKSEEEN